MIQHSNGYINIMVKICALFWFYVMRVIFCITSKHNDILYISNAKSIFKVRDTDIYLTVTSTLTLVGQQFFGTVDFAFGQVNFQSTCPNGQVVLRSCVGPCYNKKKSIILMFPVDDQYHALDTCFKRHNKVSSRKHYVNLSELDTRTLLSYVLFFLYCVLFLVNICLPNMDRISRVPATTWLCSR